MGSRDGFVELVFMLGFKVGVKTEAKVGVGIGVRESDFDKNLSVTILYPQQT